MRDWRSGIVTVTVRDQRMRQHDPILGVVPLKLADILQTSSQVTRWYPLDGGIGYGRVRISILFRSVETRLPPTQLGWDVGTFEFMSNKILALGYNTHTKLKLRTGGSSGKISRTQCRKTDEGDGIYWDIAKKEGKNNVRLPVRYRYRSPIVFEFHSSNKRQADAYAVVWLHHLEDMKEEAINIPIWKTDNGMRLSQNYITEENFKAIPDLELEEVGRLQFRARFKPGTDEDHSRFVTDNDSRETQETWEACHSEGVRDRVVTKEMPEAVQALHDQSLSQGRDVLAMADEDERKKWLSKDGTDWSGAFGKDPAVYASQMGARRYGKAANGTSEGGDENRGNTNENMNEQTDDEDRDYESSNSSSDLGVHDAMTEERTSEATDEGSRGKSGSSHSSNPIGQIKEYNENKKGLHRKQRGLMQWKPVRNLAFAKDEAKFAVRRTFKMGSLSGRQPDVETET